MAMSLEEFLEEWNNSSPYIHVQTSGSTGVPKPMLVEKRRMLNSARITCDFLGLHEGDTALLCMSLDYIAGKMMVVRAIERGLKLIVQEPSGHPMAMTQRGNWGTAPRVRSLRSTSGTVPSVSPINFAAMVPMQVYNSLQVPEERERLMQIKNLIIGGGAIDDALSAELKTFPNAVWSTYGMTETLSHIALRRLSGPEASEFYTPFPSVRVSLSDEGCLAIDAPEVCQEPLVTNDIIICSGGLKIQAEEVERQLRPFMREPYIISKRPDAKFGEIVVLLTEGSVDEAREVCQRVLPKYHQPRAYIHLDHIPLTETGKPARKQAESLVKKR